MLLLLGIGVTASIGQLLLTKAFTGGDPAKVSVIGLTQVLFAFLFDVFQEDALETVDGPRHGVNCRPDRLGDADSAWSVKAWSVKREA